MEGRFLNQDETYLKALEELALPYPSTPLLDWPVWNEFTGGFRSREFTIFCGPTGAGKTMFLANMSAQLLKQNVKHFVMSVETGHTDFMKRVLSVLEGRDLNTGVAVTKEYLAAMHARQMTILANKAIEFSLYENRVGVDQLIEDLKFMVDKGCKVAFIDNLNFFMEVTRSADTILEMDRVVHELVIFCKRADIHIVMVMHPRKTEGGRVESEFDIKGSSLAVQESHNVLLFNRCKDGEGERTDREIKFAKMRRRGAYVGRTILFSCEGTRYFEAATDAKVDKKKGWMDDYDRDL